VYLIKDQLSPAQIERTLIVGAGTAGKLIVQELRANPQLGLLPVAFLDDDPRKITQMLQGLIVYGPTESLVEVVRNHDLDLVVIAMPSAPGEVIRKIITLCVLESIPIKIVPGLYEILSGRVNITRLQPVKISDLLRRDPVKIDSNQVKTLLTGKRILVTGGGGSIGAELCHQILESNPSQLLALGHGENSLNSLVTYLLETGCGTDNLAIQLADIRDFNRMNNLFERFKPELVIHTAAHKNVPLLEENLEKAVTNNIIGTRQIVQLSKEHSIERFVFISTDKAVDPINVMGMTKRISEKIVNLAAVETGRPYVTVRFGNVLGSRGSVVPLFQHQIASGGPVTITDGEMERYFMTIPEAVQLILQASVFGENGEIFILDMGEPVKKKDLASDMIKLSGYEIDNEIEIIYTGIRPGERTFELLFNDDEEFSKTKHEKIFSTIIKPNFSPDEFDQQIKILEELAHGGKINELRKELLLMI